MTAHTEVAHRGIGPIGGLNTRWHELALWLYAAIVTAHWLEHLLQAFQIWVLNWPRPRANGVLGLAFPWLISSEWLHYAYAVVMLAAFVLLLPGFAGRARTWWLAALGVQVWHHLEHALLLVQAQVGHNIFGRPVPTSLAQLFLPRAELHLFYNAVVTIPMLVAIYYHMHPQDDELGPFTCSCSRRSIGPRAHIGGDVTGADHSKAGVVSTDNA